MFENSTILITGGSGSWGNELVRQLLLRDPKRIIIYSRGEISQVAMQRKFNDKRLEFVIGDVRDTVALEKAFRRGIDYVFHLAALKHVPICENQPYEAVKTNINGTENVIQASIRYGVKKVIDISTDKAVDPVNVYGMTKGIGERLIIQANCQTNDTDFICIRGGNVLGTNGSLVPHFINQIKTRNFVTVTDLNMTRYFLTLEKAVHLLFFAAEEGIGGETYVMNMPSFYIHDLADILVDHYGNHSTKIKIVGKREGEKVHESLISHQEVYHTTYVNEFYYMIAPQIMVNRNLQHSWSEQKKVPHTASFTSKDNLQSKQYLHQLLMEGGFLV